MAGKSAASFIVLAARSIKPTKSSISGISFLLPESSPLKTVNKFLKSQHRYRSINSWSKPIAHILHRSRFAENGVNPHTRGWSRKKSRVRAAFRWKKSLAQQRQLRKNSSDLSAGKIDMGRVGIVVRYGFAFGTALILASCAAPRATEHHIVVSVRDQKLALLQKGNLVATYPISTSKFGLSDRPGSYGTPLGELEIADKIGDGAPAGTVFKDRRRTGEVVAVNAPGRDPIVTRIIWLSGRERQNAHAFARDIYIHGTPEERNIGRPASYGCIRMRSADIVNLYGIIGRGAQVTVLDAPIVSMLEGLNSASQMAETNHAIGVIR